MVRPVLIACGLLAAGCCLPATDARAADREGAPGGDGERRAGPGRAKAAAKLVSRSVWGLVPDAPARKAEVAPGMVRGSAVAVDAGRLLASCRAVAGRERVGLVRHNKYRLARVVASGAADEVCVLSAPDAPLNVAAGFRSLGDLRPGEPVYALASRGGAEPELAEGRMADGGAGDGSRIVAALALPPDVLSAVLFDGDGNLLGLGAAAGAGRTIAGPVTALLAPGLANRDAGIATPAPAAAAVAAPSAAPSPDGEDPASAQAPGGAERRLRATLTTSRGRRPLVRADERITALLETSGDAFAYCYYADASGRVSRIFPNRFQPDALVRAGRAVEIPGAAAGFELAPDEPGTSEELSCLVREREAGPDLAPALGTVDLTPLRVGSLDEVAAAFRAAAGGGGGVVEARLTVEVAP
jgi:hypothetical protein